MNITDNILDQVRVASPCTARWQDMTGDDHARFCAQCSKNVYNLSAMTRGEVERLIRRTEGRFCGRFHRRQDGTLLTSDCPTGRRAHRNRLMRWFGAVCGMFLFLILGKAPLRANETKPTGGESTPTTNHPNDFELLGEVVPDPPVMGIIAIPTNPPVQTNTPAIMGRITLPPSTNTTVQAPAEE